MGTTFPRARECVAPLHLRSVGFECLPEDAAKVMSLFLEVVTSPAFGEEKVALAKTQALDYIAHRNDAPAAIPAREVRRLLYGPQSPYARLPTRANVEGLTRDDLLQFAAKWQRPDLGYLGIGEDRNDTRVARA